MAFTNRLFLVVPSFGTPIQNDPLFLKQGTVVAAGPVTTSLAGLTPALKQGFIRIKVSAGTGTTPTLVRCEVTLTDGTTTEAVFDYNPNVAPSILSPNQVTLTNPFLSELGVTQVNVITTLGGTGPGGTLDIEVSAGN